MSAPNSPTTPPPDAGPAASSPAATGSNSRTPSIVVFPPSITTEPPSPWRRRAFTAGILSAAIIVIGTVAFARSFNSSAAQYRTAVVANHDVASTLIGVASIEPTSQAAVAFSTSGTVIHVYVGVGDTVAVGGRLASIDPQSLIAALHQKQGELASAQLALSQATSVSTASSSSTAASSHGSNNSTNSGSGNTITDAQQSVLSSQSDVDTALAASDEAQANAAQVCAAVTGGHGPPNPPASIGPAALPPATPDSITACQQAQ